VLILEVDWASLHKILSDTTRRSIIVLLAEREALSYTEIMTLLQITNTGRLNYHLKVLGSLLTKDEGGRYHLTEQGQQAASLLKTFPERVPPEKNLSALKVTAAVVLILLGALLIVAFVIALLFAAGPISTSTESHAGLSAQTIAQNTTVYLTGWPLSAPALNIAWSAASPVRIFILNQTEYDNLLLRSSNGAQTPTVTYNFTGTPESWVRDFDAKAGNVSVSLPRGEYYFYAWSGTPNLLDSFGLTQAQTQAEGSSFSPFFILYLTVFAAIGVFLIVLAASILTRRVWR
jgi:hypothetical protein